MLRTLSNEIAEGQKSINGVIDTVESHADLRMSEGQTGEVITGSGVAPGDRRSDEELERDQALAQELTERITRAVEGATEADQTAKAALEMLSPAAAGLEREVTGSDNTVAAGDILDCGAAPKQVHKWWNSLSPLQQESAIYRHGDTIGGMDGIPIAARDRANQATFAEDHASLKTRVAELDEIEYRNPSQQREYDTLKGKLRGMDAINQRLEQNTSGKPQSYLIDFSPKGNGRGVVATGNPNSAGNVVTSVPGTGADLAGIDTDLERSERILQKTDRNNPQADTAAITWVGYEAPPGLGEAATDEYAEDAAGDLQNFQDGLRATHEGGESTNTLIGHSYGSTVIGHAAQQGQAQLDVDNAILIGSPGVDAEHASDLQLPEGADVYASTAENDMIRGTYVPYYTSEIQGADYDIHGTPPIADAFGAHTFESSAGTEGPWYTGGLSKEAHSEYWDPHSKSLKSMSRIVAGKEPS